MWLWSFGSKTWSLRFGRFAVSSRATKNGVKLLSDVPFNCFLWNFVFLVSIVINKYWITESFCNIMDIFSDVTSRQKWWELKLFETHFLGKSVLELVQGNTVNVLRQCMLKKPRGYDSGTLLLPRETLLLL